MHGKEAQDEGLRSPNLADKNSEGWAFIKENTVMFRAKNKSLQ